MGQDNIDENFAGIVEAESLDVSGHVGKKVPIAAFEIRESQYTNNDGTPKKFLYVETEPVDTVTINEEPVELKGSAIFGFAKAPDGRLGFIEKSKGDLLFKKLGITKPSELVGKTVQLQTRTDKNGKDWLTFGQ